MKLVECVPNFSEGRRPEVLDEIVDAMTTVDGTRLLDKEMDADHNRAVVTIIGEPESVLEAAFRGISKAPMVENSFVLPVPNSPIGTGFALLLSR